MAPSRAMRTAKRCHFALTFLYALVSMAIFLLPFIFVHYVSTFQFSAVATVHLITGIMVAGLVFYAALVLLVWSGKKGTPDDVFTSPEDAQKFFDRSIMYMYSGLAVILAVCVVLSLAAIGIELYNLMAILFVECPQLTPLPPHHNHSHHAWSVTENVMNPRHYSNTLDVLVNYREEESQHILLLKYNLTDRHIVQHSRVNAQTHWVRSQARQMEQEQSPICSDASYSQFHHLESEIEQALEQRLQQFNAQKSVIIQGHDFSLQSNELEDRIFFDMMVREICRNEYGFVVFLIVFLLLIALLNFILLGWFLYIRRYYK